MSLALVDLDAQEREERGWARLTSALLKMVMAVSDLEDEARAVGELPRDAVQTIEGERERLKTIVAVYGRG